MLNVLTCSELRTAMAVTRLESIPPLRRMPTRTSALNCRATASCSNVSSSSTSADWSTTATGSNSGISQYCQTLAKPEHRSKLSAWAAGNFR